MRFVSMVGFLGFLTACSTASTEGPDVSRDFENIPANDRPAVFNSARKLDVGVPIESVYQFPDDIRRIYKDPVSEDISVIDDVLFVKNVETLENGQGTLGIVLMNGDRYVIGNPERLSDWPSNTPNASGAIPHSERAEFFETAERLEVGTSFDSVYNLPDEVSMIAKDPDSRYDVTSFGEIVAVQNMENIRNGQGALGIILMNGDRYIIGDPERLAGNE